MQTPNNNPEEKHDTIRVSALHALAYCPRLFYLEEVEELLRKTYPNLTKAIFSQNSELTSCAVGWPTIPR
ncbi:MAG: hypothetical protein MUE44_03675 [Oscillatoriaceae cyanobacterium Prado104]|jgi:hypothetical protein|nr:hypothetical protein [Oscillatoriaceae cyanobacterium Prado104]